VEVRAALNVIAGLHRPQHHHQRHRHRQHHVAARRRPGTRRFEIILQTRGLDSRRTGNVIWIAPRDELATREKLALEAANQITDLEPLRTEIFQLNYHKAEAFVKVLTDDKQRILSKRGSAVVDPRSNKLFINDTPARLEEIRRVILGVDVPVRQVMIEARIVEANDSFSKNLGGGSA
jgi:type IV pilus assembly protein PilQ